MADQQTNDWPELAVGLFDRLTGRGAVIHYEFDQMQIKIPSGVGTDAKHAAWVLSGKLRISTEMKGSAPNS
ncbi:hypothetical protein Pla175_10970 [Pirellulimonas nuda]|uniref:Uncharacterized protein n=1 Tax=Pirellulimonas nuda TaxID=2528009 RepID=A0A518D8C1_9BACT|nr:hypothetical protein Pla175_10970 [Pirellulimonas nuda]